MLGEEDAMILGQHQFNLECVENGTILILHKNVLFYNFNLISKKTLLFWEANEKKEAVLNQIKSLAQEKLRHYQQRIKNIREREENIYQNYKLQKQIHNKSLDNSEILKENLLSKTNKNSEIHIRINSEFLDQTTNDVEISRRIVTEDNANDVGNSLMGIECCRKKKAAKTMKDLSEGVRNLFAKLGNQDNVQIQKILKKKQINSIDFCEKQMEEKIQMLSERNCYNYILSKLAPIHYQDIKRKMKIKEKILNKKLPKLI